VPLLGKHGRNPFAPDFLHFGQDAQFVVDQYIMIGRVKTLNILKLLLLVDADEDPVVKRAPEAGSFHFARLEYGTPELRRIPEFAGSLLSWLGMKPKSPSTSELPAKSASSDSITVSHGAANQSRPFLNKVVYSLPASQISKRGI
jgi:hypothetical protein